MKPSVPDTTSSSPEQGFKIKRITKIDDLAKMPTGDAIVLPESDLCIQHEDVLVQMDFVRHTGKKRNVKIKPGVYSIINSPMGVDIEKTELQSKALLETIDNTSKILTEADLFFNNLHVYDELGQAKKRAVLLYSPPGCGKSSAIAKSVKNLIEKDPGTVVMVWPTSEVEADDLSDFLSMQSEYTAESTRLILIIEDIGGGERDDAGGQAGVDSGLLNLLDGVTVTFKKPTFIIATTNFPDKLLSVLADRPGRFDETIELAPPSFEERCKLVAFIAKRDLTESEEDALFQQGAEKFSIAHLNEVVVRSRLKQQSLEKTIKDLIKHTEKFNKGFKNKRKSMGIGDE